MHKKRNVKISTIDNYYQAHLKPTATCPPPNVNTSPTCLKVLNGLQNVVGTFRLSRTFHFKNN